MIGFSGDDPNFEAWTGWVRDNLGSAAPPIYMCGILDLDNARRSYYASRNIKTINLGPLFPASDWPNQDSRHAAATEWLLLSLAEGAPVDSMLWPSSEKRLPPLPLADLVRSHSVKRSRASPIQKNAEEPATRSTTSWQPSDGIPPVLPSEAVPGPIERGEGIRGILSRAQFLRRTYPSWLVCPVTTSFQLEVRDWYRAFKETDLPDFELVYSVAWGFDVLHWPLPTDLVEAAAKHLDAAPATAIHAERLSVLRWLIREAREDDDKDGFLRWIESFARVSRSVAGLAAEWWLEKAKFHFMRLELDETEDALAQTGSQPIACFVDVSRASIMFELGHFREAAELAARAVDEIRRNAPPEGAALRALGEEASALDLALTATFSARLGHVSLGTGYQRREELRRTGADPRAELEILGLDMAKARPPERSTTKGFDPDVYTRHVIHRYGTETILPFKYLRALDMAAQLPHNHAEHVELAAVDIASHRPGLALSLLIRSGRSLDRAFSRDAILRFSESQVRQLWERCVRFLRWLLEQGPEAALDFEDSFLKRATNSTIDLLSRLTLRSTVATREECLKLAISLHESDVIRRHWPAHQWLKNLFSRLFLSMSFDEVASALPSLIEMSIPGVGGSPDVPEHSWQEPCYMLSPLPLGQRLFEQRSAIHARVHQLIDIVSTSLGLRRTIAVQRIEAIRAADGLDDGALQAYADALWVSQGTLSIPDVDGFLFHLGLNVPASERHDAVQRFVAWATTTPLPPLFIEEPLPASLSEKVVGRRTLRRSTSHWVRRHVRSLSHCTAIPGSACTQRTSLVDWTPEQARSLLFIVESWLPNVQAPSSASEHASFADDRDRDAVQDVADFVAACLVPRVGDGDASVARRLVNLNAQFRALHVVPLDAHVTWLSVDSLAPIATTIEAGLSSMDPDVVRECMGLASEWAAFAEAGKAPTMPDSVVDHLLVIAFAGAGPSRISALRTIREVIFHSPASFSGGRRPRLEAILQNALKPISPTVDESEGGWPVELQGDYRAAAAGVVALLALGEPSGSDEMRELANRTGEDVFPEVRREFETVRERLVKLKKTSSIK